MMDTARKKSFQHYVDRIQRHLLRKYPHLKFQLAMRDGREGTIYYAPYAEEDDWDIIHRTGSIAVDALVRDDYVIHIQPAPELALADLRAS
jgi:hypothetical protein